MVNSSEVPAPVATRARIVLWCAEGRQKRAVAALAGVSRPTVDLWLRRFATDGVGGLLDRARGAAREQVPAAVRARILAVTKSSPPVETGLSHWSSREMARFISRTEGVSVSHHYVAKLWRQTGFKPHHSDTFKVSRDPAFAEKVADVIGLYLDPPGGAVVLSIDEKTQIQALDRTQPLLPIAFDATEKRTHDYVRHGTTNLFAALNVGTGHVYGECKPTRNGADFLAFLKKAVKPHTGTDIHVVLDNLSTHTTPDVETWLQQHDRGRLLPRRRRGDAATALRAIRDPGRRPLPARPGCDRAPRRAVDDTAGPQPPHGPRCRCCPVPVPRPRSGQSVRGRVRRGPRGRRHPGSQD